MPKKLTLSSNKMVAGVCAGFADYFGVDVTLVRILWLFLVCVCGFGVLAYLICWLVIPKQQ